MVVMTKRSQTTSIIVQFDNAILLKMLNKNILGGGVISHLCYTVVMLTNISFYDLFDRRVVSKYKNFLVTFSVL